MGKRKPDTPVIGPWLSRIRTIASDLISHGKMSRVPSQVHAIDARQPARALGRETVDAVITSPPYPNEKDYTRTTRLESVLLGFITSKADLRSLKGSLVRSNTRGVYKGDDDDDWIAGHPRIQEIADQIEARRVMLGKTSGFERMYPRVATLYFGGMARHLAGLRYSLRPGARLAYVVGDQASYLRVMIRTGEILAEIAERLGYQVEGLDLFRTRLATATKGTITGRSTTTPMEGGITLRVMTQYDQIIEHVFFSHFRRRMRQVPFSREEMAAAAARLDSSGQRTSATSPIRSGIERTYPSLLGTRHQQVTSGLSGAQGHRSTVSTQCPFSICGLTLP